MNDFTKKTIRQLAKNSTIRIRAYIVAIVNGDLSPFLKTLPLWQWEQAYSLQRRGWLLRKAIKGMFHN